MFYKRTKEGIKKCLYEEWLSDLADNKIKETAFLSDIKIITIFTGFWPYPGKPKLFETAVIYPLDGISSFTKSETMEKALENHEKIKRMIESK